MSRRTRVWNVLRTRDAIHDGARVVDMLAFMIPVVVAIILSFIVGRSGWLMLSFLVGILFMWWSIIHIPTYRDDRPAYKRAETDKAAWIEHGVQMGWIDKEGPAA